MKKALLFMALMSVPLLLYLNAWQAFRYDVVKSDTTRLEAEQQEWLESNKKIVIGIEVLGSPARIDAIAKEMEGVEKKPGEAGIRIDVTGTSGGGDG